MSEFIKLSSSDRRVLFEQASLQTGYSAAVLEKDAWVCWILKILFSLKEIPPCLTFKGGTSLSKAYGLIERFSEDIDLTIDKEIFGQSNEALEKLSGTARERQLEELTEKTKAFVHTSIERNLSAFLSNNLTGSWKLEVDSKDPLSLLFHFPTSLTKEQFAYLTPYIKLEFGTRSDTWPSENRKITSYISESFPEIIAEDLSCSIPVLCAERTFWEKATILHAEYHRSQDKPLQLRIARHYYDLFCMANSPIGDVALQNLNLLERVASHKNLFFRAGWAKYNEAKPGSLHLVPSNDRLTELENDYKLMREMFFTEPPKFESILSGLSELERRINT